MQAYLELLQHIIDNGVKKSDRTGTGTMSCFGYQMRFDLQKGFPLVTTKKLHVKSIIYELLWFLKGDTNIKWLKENGISISNKHVTFDSDHTITRSCIKSCINQYYSIQEDMSTLYTLDKLAGKILTKDLQK